jgi:allantoicase
MGIVQEYLISVLGDDDWAVPDTEEDAITDLIESHKRQREIIHAYSIRMCRKENIITHIKALIWGR